MPVISPEVVHKFEMAGLGKAPFKYTGMEERRGPIRTTTPEGFVVEVGSPGQPMGTCDFCGTGIALCFYIESADGKHFIVGSECVLKTGDSGLKKVIAEDKRNHDRIVREARREKKAAEFDALISQPEVRAALAAKPHPHAYFSAQGKTYLDYIEFCTAMSSGKASWLNVVKDLIAA